MTNLEIQEQLNQLAQAVASLTNTGRLSEGMRAKSEVAFVKICTKYSWSNFKYCSITNNILIDLCDGNPPCMNLAIKRCVLMTKWSKWIQSGELQRPDVQDVINMLKMSSEDQAEKVLTSLLLEVDKAEA
ncbi:hypothetical protein FWG86_01805 [Candidatus Saccharibacteria bacterium]|nr:hypothetical protein [Candidatus Saccharibacteria bacterium]